MANAEITGRVVSNKMAKSVVVTVERQVRDGLYGKQLRLTSRFMAHDEQNAAKVGDRVAMARGIKRGGKIWIRVFPDKPVTKKPQETRMGKGKGAPEGWVVVVKPGRILFEMEGVSEIDARAAMRLAQAKLPIKTRFATRFAEERVS